MITAAVDPGLSGAIAIFNGKKLVRVARLPTTKLKTKKIIDPAGFVEQLSTSNVDQVVIEHVGASPQMGVSGAFSFGFSFGVLIGACEGGCFSWDTIAPSYWKAYNGLIKKPKDTSRKLAISLYPEVSELLKLKKSVDLAEAILIGRAFLDIKEMIE